jgi:hypothetical protein
MISFCFVLFNQNEDEHVKRENEKFCLKAGTIQNKRITLHVEQKGKILMTLCECVGEMWEIDDADSDVRCLCVCGCNG